MDDLYLDNIDEYVNDQNRVVTYKWLSLTLGVHVNTAKQMLYQYLEQRRKERSGTTLHATYLVSGKCVENGNKCHKVSVVREDKLEDMKSRLDVTVSVHVYSVQKAELKDSAPLYSTDYDAVKENLKNCSKRLSRRIQRRLGFGTATSQEYSAIRCAAALPMSAAQPHRAQEQSLAAVPDHGAKRPAPTSSTAPPAKTKQPTGIMGMFSGKAGTKSAERKREVKTEQQDSPADAPKTKTSSKTNAMNNFFGKSAAKKVAADPDKNTKAEADGSVNSAAGRTEETHASPESQPDTKEEVTVEKNDSKDSRVSKTKRLEPSDSEDERVEGQKKKRRRIKKPQLDSSDDDDDDGVIPDSPPVPEVHTPSPKKHVKKEPASQENSEGRTRKRRRVLKSRTFVDDEDCIVTEKGYESESYSESEEDSKTTKPSEDSGSLKQLMRKRDEEKKVKEKAQKKAANKPVKQASIMGFFQKK